MADESSRHDCIISKYRYLESNASKLPENSFENEIVFTFSESRDADVKQERTNRASTHCRAVKVDNKYRNSEFIASKLNEEIHFE